MSNTSPVLMWFRRDLRLGDNPALVAAVATGRPVIPVFLDDEVSQGLGAAPRWRLGLGAGKLAENLKAVGSRLILRRGPALDALKALIEETGAGSVFWGRLYDPDAMARDSAVKAALREAGIEAQSFAGHLCAEPWEVETGAGSYYKVYTPFWRRLKEIGVGPALPPPGQIPPPAQWSASDHLPDWQMGAKMNRGAKVVAGYAKVGQEAAHRRLEAFLDDRVEGYRTLRDFPAVDATSGLSENLAVGEISARSCWNAGMRALNEGAAGAEHFLKELAWREFAYHLVYHTPRITDQNWRPEWDGFDWKTDPHAPEVLAWKQGRTGEPFVDAAMRQLYVTGTMHNRARMIAASYLTKHLMCHWKIGKDWFEECLIDWDPASNAMGWQWVAGSGPDASPYFRIFNPATQAEKFDPKGEYRKKWIAEGQGNPPDTALAFFEAAPRAWGLGPGDPYPDRLIDLAEGRLRALDAYKTHRG